VRISSPTTWSTTRRTWTSRSALPAPCSNARRFDMPTSPTLPSSIASTTTLIIISTSV